MDRINKSRNVTVTGLFFLENDNASCYSTTPHILTDEDSLNAAFQGCIREFS